MGVASPPVNLSLSPDVRTGLLTRRTLRTFHKRPVSAGVRASVLEAARWAPAAGDTYPVRLIVPADSCPWSRDPLETLIFQGRFGRSWDRTREFPPSGDRPFPASGPSTREA